MPDGVGQEERGRNCRGSQLLVSSTSCRYLEGLSSGRRMGRARHFCHGQRHGIRRRAWAPAPHHATSDSVVRFGAINVPATSRLSTVDVSVTTRRDLGATIQADRSKYSTPPLTVEPISPTASRAPRPLPGTLAVPLKSTGGWATERSHESQR
jgi:hypothetical protein